MHVPRLLRPLLPTRLPLYGLGLSASLPIEEQAPTKARAWVFILLLTAFLGTCYYVFIFNRAMVELELETDTRTVLKLYWPNRHGNYSESKSAWLLIKPGQTSYSVWTADISRLDRLRLDPSEKPANITIRRITVRQSGFPPWEIHSKEEFRSQVHARAQVEVMTPLDTGGLSLTIRQKDSQLELSLPKRERQVSWPDELGHALAMLLLAAVCFQLYRLCSTKLNFIPVLAVFALALILVMATISDFNTHPDEPVHVAAGEYYQNHTLPPKVGDPTIAHTYSGYGVSRLHSGEIHYLLAGKFMRLIQPLHLKPYFAMRLFNVLLFLGLTLHAFRRREFRFFLLPLLISPQIWYLFSYAASDALSLVFCLAAAWQLAAERSALNTLLRDEHEPKPQSWFTSPLLLGLLLGVLLLQKQNFYYLYIFFLLYFIWRIWLAPPAWNRRTLARFTGIVMTGTLLFTAVRVTDAWVNDFHKEELLLAAREQYAAPMYKPSTPLEKKHFYLQMRDRGKTLKQFIEFDRWGEKSFRTAFGVYGYTQYAAPFAYYDYVRAVGLLLIFTLVGSAIWRGGLPGLVLTALALGWTVFFLAGLIWHAWTVDFQAQGRYLLPIVPMLAMLYYHCQRILIKPVFYGLFFLLVLLSVYNFIFVGLYDIGKVML